MGMVKDTIDGLTKTFRDTVEYFIAILMVFFVAGEFYVLWAYKINHPSYIYYPIIIAIIYLAYMFLTKK